MKNFRKSLLIAAAAFAPLFLSAQKAEEMKFVNADQLHIVGSGFDVSHVKYGRIPESLKGEMRPELIRLGANSSGIAVRFSTNSKAIAARWKVTQNVSLNHMPATGVKGLDLYAFDGKGWKYAGTARPSGVENFSVFIKNMNGEKREYIAYFPLYDGVELVEIGVMPEAEIGIPQSSLLTKRAEKKPVVIYGTSITQGGCASRPGMAYPAILGRMMDRETINLGFSGNGRMDFPMAKAINLIDAHAVVLDCLPNTNAQIVRDSAYNFIKLVAEKNPARKVYMVENVIFPPLFLDLKTKAELEEENIEWRKVYAQLRKDGIKNVIFIPGKDLLGEDGETTVDGVHFTDLGFQRFAKSLFRYVK
jgi:hypothetical protein